MIKLGIGDALQATFVAFWRGGWPMALCLILWIGVEFGNDVGQQQFNPFGRVFGVEADWLVEPLPWSVPGALGLAFMAMAGFHDLITCVFIAAMLRIVLLGRVGPWGVGRDGFLRACGGVLLVNVAVTAMTNGPPWLLSFVFVGSAMRSVPGVVIVALWILFILFVLYLSARLCLTYPSVAAGRGLAVRRNWRSSAGNGIRLSMVFLMALLAYLFASSIFEVLLYPTYLRDGRDGLTAMHLWIAGKDAIIGVLTLAFLLILSAVAFARLTEYPAVGIPGSSKTPKQLAEAFE